MTDHQAALTYSSYLALGDVLGAQRTRSDEHDELLFIVIHQVYELWFKQLLHEGTRLQRLLEEGGSTPHALHTLKRILTILKTIVAQIDVLETMTPRQFLAFRDRLDAASGFQSAQFRELEAVLGRREATVLEAHPAAGPARARIAAAMARRSLYDSFLVYLAAHGFAVSAEVIGRDLGVDVRTMPGGGASGGSGRGCTRFWARPCTRASGSSCATSSSTTCWKTPTWC